MKKKGLLIASLLVLCLALSMSIHILNRNKDAIVDAWSIDDGSGPIVDLLRRTMDARRVLGVEIRNVVTGVLALRCDELRDDFEVQVVDTDGKVAIYKKADFTTDCNLSDISSIKHYQCCLLFDVSGDFTGICYTQET